MLQEATFWGRGYLLHTSKFEYVAVADRKLTLFQGMEDNQLHPIAKAIGKLNNYVLGGGGGGGPSLSNRPLMKLPHHN